MTRIWAAVVAAVTTGFLSTFALPAAAWADQLGVVAELQRRRPRIGFFGLTGVLCCLVVVAGIVAVVFLVSRRRR
ncbi:MAG TPA: hypothetical protein VFC19_37420 [Candidatus Limnocylindrales bacterium]|nr:hypothetical protein [Candidatus Limnocylindrales bacterium]